MSRLNIGTMNARSIAKHLLTNGHEPDPLGGIINGLCDEVEAMQAEIDRLKAEIARLRNIMNEDGLHDPELAKLAGKRRDALEASNEQGGRKFRASLDRQGK